MSMKYRTGTPKEAGDACPQNWSPQNWSPKERGRRRLPSEMEPPELEPQREWQETPALRTGAPKRKETPTLWLFSLLPTKLNEALSASCEYHSMLLLKSWERTRKRDASRHLGFPVLRAGNCMISLGVLKGYPTLIQPANNCYRTVKSTPS